MIDSDTLQLSIKNVSHETGSPLCKVQRFSSTQYSLPYYPRLSQTAELVYVEINLHAHSMHSMDNIFALVREVVCAASGGVFLTFSPYKGVYFWLKSPNKG